MRHRSKGATPYGVYARRGITALQYSLLLLAGGGVEGWGDDVLCWTKIHYEALRREVVD